jgi:type VI secretion system secreted protein Hcp
MAFDMFLKLTGIKGESKDAAHKDEIHIESFSWGATQSGAFGAGGGGGAGKVNMNDASFSKHVDKASPELFLHCANGKHIPEGLLTIRKAGEKPVEYLKLKFTDLLVSSIQHAGGSHGDQLMENLSLNFAEVRLEYQEQGEDGKPVGGPVKTGWNVKKNEKV